MDVDDESERSYEGGIAFSIAAAGEVLPNAEKLETEPIDQRAGDSRCRNLSERTTEPRPRRGGDVVAECSLVSYRLGWLVLKRIHATQAGSGRGCV